MRKSAAELVSIISSTTAEGICEVRQSKRNRETLVTNAKAALPRPESAGDFEGAPSQDRAEPSPPR